MKYFFICAACQAKQETTSLLSYFNARERVREKTTTPMMNRMLVGTKYMTF
jgi:hypothetical protein